MYSTTLYIPGFHLEKLARGGSRGRYHNLNDGRGHRILIRDHFLYDIIDIHEILGGEAGELGGEAYFNHTHISGAFPGDSPDALTIHIQCTDKLTHLKTYIYSAIFQSELRTFY